MSQNTQTTTQTDKKPVPRLKLFGNLLTEVVKKNLCVGCGACAAVCPVNVVEMTNVSGKDQQPTLTGKCILCEICYYQCPAIEPLPELGEIFGREKNENESFGVMIGCYSAKAKKEEIIKVAQDGGIVTGLLAYGLQADLLDSAVVSGVDDAEPWKAVPKVATSFNELLEHAGTRYTTSPTLMGLWHAVEGSFKEKVAVVGTPCQIKATRKMQKTPKAALRYGSKTVLTVGLLCMESFYHDTLIKEYLKEKTDLSKISRCNIRKGKFIVDSGGQRVIDVPLSEVKQYARDNCHSCTDFTAELADISVGSVGSPEGWSTVIIRTDTGKKIFDGATEAGFIEYKPIEEVKPGIISVEKLSKIKKERCPT